MTNTAKVPGSSSSQGTRLRWRERWIELRDLLAGVLLLAAWLALWTVTWAAVAGPLRPGEPARAEAAAAVART